MSTSRTWLSIVGLSLTLQTLHKLHIASGRKTSTSGRVEEEALVLVSMGILLIAAAHHVSFISTRPRRHGTPAFFVIALSLVMLGIIAISSMAFAVGRLG